MAALIVVLILVLYVDTLLRVLRRSKPAVAPYVKTHTAFVVSVYPVVALATLCAVVVPRAQLLAEAVTQGVFMAAVYQLWCLLVAYCGGEDEMIRRVQPGPLDLRVGPCCCWTCCRLPMLPVNKRNVSLVRALVLQLPVVQGLLYLVLLVMWAEEERLYELNYMYLQPVVVLSILLGVWGLLMTIKMLSSTLAGHMVPAKFAALQAVLLLSKFQGGGARGLAWYGLLPCRPPLSPAVYANLLYNCAMLVEMLLLALLARFLYTRELPVPDISVSARAASCSAADRAGLGLGLGPTPTQVCVIEALPANQLRAAGARPHTADPLPGKESNNNNSINDDSRMSYKF